MTIDPAAGSPRPAFGFIRLDEDGRPYLHAIRCRNCGAAYPEAERLACARCGARGDALEAFRPEPKGRVHAASIVRRGYAGVPTPFVSAIVDLDDGLTLKGVLRGAGAEPDVLTPGRPVRVVFDDALGRRDAEGHAYISHFFEPE